MSLNKYRINPRQHNKNQVTPHESKYVSLQHFRDRSVRRKISNFGTQREAVESSLSTHSLLGKGTIRQNLDGSWRNQQRDTQPSQWLPKIDTLRMESGNIRGRTNNQKLIVNYIPSRH